jgi:hypothetical protein
MLTQHPDIEHRLRQEIFETVGPTGSPTYEQMREMKYTRAFLNGMNHYISGKLDTKVDIPSRGSQTLPTGVSIFSVPGSDTHISEVATHSSPSDSRISNKPVVLPSIDGRPPIYIPANTTCV